jgi:hypothetical protein
MSQTALVSSPAGPSSPGLVSSSSSSLVPSSAPSSLVSKLSDPSTGDGHVLQWEKEVTLEVRRSTDLDDSVGALLPVRVKVLTRFAPHSSASAAAAGAAAGSPQLESTRVELSLDDDLFFSLYHQISEADYKSVALRQRLMIEFADYPKALIKNFNRCLAQSHT